MNFFDPNSGIMGFLGKVFDVILLSIVWIIFSIPIITIGASTTALYYSAVKAIRRERGYVFREFWKSFKTNFINATILWIPLMILISIFYKLNIKFALELGGPQGFVLLCIYCMFGFALICTGIYMFPILSRFTMTRMQTIKSAAFMAIKHFPITLVLLVIVGATVFGLYVLPIVFIFLPATSAIIFSFLMEPILKKYTPQSEGDEPKDEWYLE